MTDLIAVLASADLPDVQGAPDLVHLLPAGLIKARDGRRFILDDMAGVIERSKPVGSSVDLPIDYEHQNDTPEARANGPVPAAGWITELVAKEDRIWGRVKWTDKGRAQITAREYRYLSPVMIAEKVSGKITKLNGAGLVHSPALEMKALAGLQNDAAKAAGAAVLGRIATALGLTEDAGELAILAAITSQDGVDPARFVPAEAVQDLLRDRSEAVVELRELKTKRVIDEAIKAGHITPAMRDWATQLCGADPEQFEATILSVNPEWGHLSAPSGLDDREPPSLGQSRADTSGIATQLGLPPERLA